HHIREVRGVNIGCRLRGFGPRSGDVILVHAHHLPPVRIMPRPLAVSVLLILLPLGVAAQVTVQEYPVPRGHRVHDVWADAAPDGPVWISAQGSGELGILDPKSGKFDFVPLGPGSAPHGVIAGADGAPWLTDGGQNAIVRVDPKSKQVKVWK